MKIKIDPADTAFSQYIRLRDMKCVRCGSQVGLNDKGLPNTHQNSHYFSRGRENTRFDPQNCDTLCAACHWMWGGERREEYKEFKIKQLGLEGFKRLDVKAHTPGKKDRKLSLLLARELLKTL